PTVYSRKAGLLLAPLRPSLVMPQDLASRLIGQHAPLTDSYLPRPEASGISHAPSRAAACQYRHRHAAALPSCDKFRASHTKSHRYRGSLQAPMIDFGWSLTVFKGKGENR